MTYTWQRWMAKEFRAAGLTVIEVKGWENRGRPASTGAYNPQGPLTKHHTGTRTSAKSPGPTLRTLIEGRDDLPGPLAPYTVRADGVVVVIAAGRCNHAGRVGKSGVKGMPLGADGNALAMGDEVDTDGRQTMPAVQRHAVDVTAAVVLRHFDRDASWLHRHQDISAAGKWDLGGVSTASLRASAARELSTLNRPKPQEPTVTPLPLAYRTRMPANTQRAHYPTTTGDGLLSLERTAKLAPGPDRVRAQDVNLQTLLLSVDGTAVDQANGYQGLDGPKVRVAVCLHWRTLGQNGWVAFINKDGDLQRLTAAQQKWTVQRFVDGHGGDVDALHRLRRLDTKGRPTEGPLTAHEAMRHCKRLKVAPCWELKDNAFEDPQVLARLQASAKTTNMVFWPMALEEMHAKQKAAACHHIGAPFALILGGHQDKARDPNLLRGWPAPPTYVWASTAAGRKAGNDRIRAWKSAQS